MMTLKRLIRTLDAMSDSASSVKVLAMKTTFNHGDGSRIHSVTVEMPNGEQSSIEIEDEGNDERQT